MSSTHEAVVMLFCPYAPSSQILRFRHNNFLSFWGISRSSGNPADLRFSIEPKSRKDEASFVLVDWRQTGVQLRCQLHVTSSGSSWVGGNRTSFDVILVSCHVSTVTRRRRRSPSVPDMVTLISDDVIKVSQRSMPSPTVAFARSCAAVAAASGTSGQGAATVQSVSDEVILPT